MRQSDKARRTRKLLAAVKRLWDSQPGARKFEMRLGKDRVFRRGGYTWYREPWMDEILNAYRLYRGKGYR